MCFANKYIYLYSDTLSTKVVPICIAYRTLIIGICSRIYFVFILIKANELLIYHLDILIMIWFDFMCFFIRIFMTCFTAKQYCHTDTLDGKRFTKRFDLDLDVGEQIFKPYFLLTTNAINARINLIFYRGGGHRACCFSDKKRQIMQSFLL